MSATGYSVRKNGSSLLYPLWELNTLRKVVCIWQTWKGKLFQKWSRLLHFQSLQRETFAQDICIKKESSFRFMLTDLIFLNCFIFPPSEEKTVGFRLKPPTLIHGQAPSAGESGFKHLLFWTVCWLMSCYGTFIRLFIYMIPQTVTIWTFSTVDPQSAWELERSLFDWFVSGVPSPKPKEAQRSILRPPVLQPPPARTPPQNSEYMRWISTQVDQLKEN